MFGGLVGSFREKALGESAGTTYSPLELALRRVTHTDCAAVPTDDVQEVVRFASESEEALALVLCHIDENAGAPMKEWRRINGALTLLEKMLRPGLNGEGLVGRMWYESKIEKRLKVLANFTHEEDRRIAGLIRHAASTALMSAEQHLAPYADQVDLSPSSRRGDSGSADANCTSDGSERDAAQCGDVAGTGGSGSAKSGAASELRRLNSGIPEIRKPHIDSDHRQESNDVAVTTIGRSDAYLDGPSGIDDVEAAMAATRVKPVAKRSVPGLDSVATTKKNEISSASDAASDIDPAGGWFCWCCRRRKSAAGVQSNESEDDRLL